MSSVNSLFDLSEGIELVENWFSVLNSLELLWTFFFTRLSFAIELSQLPWTFDLPKIKILVNSNYIYNY